MDVRGSLIRLGAAATLCLGAAVAQAQSAGAAPRFLPDEIEQGRDQYRRTCQQCHGLNMVNSGTTIYDLRRFPLDDPERFFSSVANGRGNMPSFKDALSTEQVKLLWAYVGSRGGREP